MTATAPPPLDLRVTEPFFPEIETYRAYLEDIWESRWLTNDGPLCARLAEGIGGVLGTANLQLVSSGTAALQLALAALDVSGSVVATPFSYAATAQAARWLGLDVVFADIDPETFCLDPASVPDRLRADTTAILATHVFGWPGDLSGLRGVARDNGLSLVYDGAHGFGTVLDGTPLALHGDATALSFHATKIFHAVEGGAVVTPDPETAARIGRMKAHGIDRDRIVEIATNAKLSELHAAMGLCLLPHVDALKGHRRAIVERYRAALSGSSVRFPAPTPGGPLEWNAAYCPILLEGEDAVLRVQGALRMRGIEARRYFYPALNTAGPFGLSQCPVAEDVARRVLCLPMSHRVDAAAVDRIGDIVGRALAARTPVAETVS